MNLMQQASLSAAKSDAVFFFVMGIAVVLLLFITATMIYLVFRYSRKRHPQAEQISGHLGLEIAWTVTPLVVFVAIFYFGWTNYDYLRRAPSDSMVVIAIAKQWSWSFEYPNGKHAKVLYAPVNRPIKVETRSLDVVHGFYVPSFRLKIDAVPAQANTTWFQATQLGSYDIECTVICGVDHSLMLSKVVVVPEDQFRAWYFGGEDAPEPGEAKPATVAEIATPPEPAGLQLMRGKGCLSCHSVDGQAKVGPTLKGFFGQKVEVVSNNGGTREETVDETHLIRSIREPENERMKGYPPTMPPIQMTSNELKEIVSFLKTLQ